MAIFSPAVRIGRSIRGGRGAGATRHRHGSSGEISRFNRRGPSPILASGMPLASRPDDSRKGGRRRDC